MDLFPSRIGSLSFVLLASQVAFASFISPVYCIQYLFFRTSIEVNRYEDLKVQYFFFFSYSLVF